MPQYDGGHITGYKIYVDDGNQVYMMSTNLQM